MTINEFSSLMNALGNAFNKRYNDDELQIYYRYFKEYDKKTFVSAIDSIITSSEKLPSIREIIEKCAIQKNRIKWREEYEQMEKPVEDKEWFDLLNSFK